MVGSIREILQIKTSDELQGAFIKYEEGLDKMLEGLERDLAKDILTPDVTDILKHMTHVESRRVVVAKQLYLVTGFTEYAKSSRFALPPGRGTTETVRDQWKKTLAGPFSALQIRLEHLIAGIDSRVNMCKKKLGLEGSVEGVRSNSRFAA
jgi:hypothetical protein